MTRRFTVALGAVIAAQALAGAPSTAAAGLVCHPRWPVVAHRSGGRPATARLPRACVAETGYAASETSLAVTRSGAIVFSPAHTENSLTRSLDGGRSWGLTYPAKMQYTSLWNTVDPYVTADRRTGRLFWVRATGDLRTAPVVVEESPFPYQVPTAIAYAHGFQVYSSADGGRTWLTADYQHENIGDWEKIFAGPPSTAPGAPKPTGYPGVVYVCGNAPFEVSGPGRACYRSLDGGGTFGLAGYVFPSGSAPNDTCPALAGNSGVVGSDGTVYQPQTCRGGAWLAISRDEGGSYTWRPVAHAPGTTDLGGGYQLAIDNADHLYALWKANDQLNLIVSRNGGRTWSAPLQIAAPGLHRLTIPALAAGRRGEVAVTYYGTADPSSKALTAYITQTSNALSRNPLFVSGALNDPAHPIYTDFGFDATPRADYVGGGYDRSGAFYAGVVKQLGRPDSGGAVPTTGYVGTLRPAPVRRCARRRAQAPRHPRRGCSRTRRR